MYKSVLAAPVRRPFLTSAVIAAVLASAAVFERNPLALTTLQHGPAADISTGSVRLAPRAEPSTYVAAEPSVPPTLLVAQIVGRAREWLNPPEQPGVDPQVEGVSEMAEPVLSALAPEPPEVVVPDLELVFLEAPPTTRHPEQASAVPETASAAQSLSTTSLSAIDRDLFVAKGEEMLARGDVGGARLSFRPAAERDDPRAVIGLARTFDPAFLRSLRVVGVRPDPDQAAYWYGRARDLDALALAAR